MATKIKIDETDEITTLSIIDPKSGVDWTNDLLGNCGALRRYDDDQEVYLMTQEEYDWWDTLVAAKQASDNRRHKLARQLLERLSDALMRDLGDVNCDLEDEPGQVHQICDLYDVMATISGGYYSADPINGVRFEGVDSEDWDDTISVREFQKALPTLKEKIMCFLDPDYADELKIMAEIISEYGLR